MQDPMQRGIFDRNQKCVNCNGLENDACGGYLAPMKYIVREYKTGQVITIYSNVILGKTNKIAYFQLF